MKNIKNILNLLRYIKWTKGKLELYRAMKVDNPHVPNIGIHWTCRYDKAYPYGGKPKAVNDPYYVYTAVVSAWLVDWPATFRAAIGPFPHEKEVVLKRGKKIKITLITRIVNLPPVKYHTKWHFPKEKYWWSLIHYTNT